MRSVCSKANGMDTYGKILKIELCWRDRTGRRRILTRGTLHGNAILRTSYHSSMFMQNLAPVFFTPHAEAVSSS